MSFPDIDVYMVAIGSDHQTMAEATRPRVEKILELPVNVIEYGEPFEVKLCLLEDAQKPVLFIDCDLVLFHWDWDYFDFNCFNAAPDMLHPCWPGTHAIQKLMPIKRFPIFNTGLWLAPPDFRSVFKLARELFYGELKDFEYRLGDQTPLNLAIQTSEKNSVADGRKGDPRILKLDQRFNKQYAPKVTADPPPGADYGVHLIGGTFENDTAQKRDRVLEYCRKYPL